MSGCPGSRLGPVVWAVGSTVWVLGPGVGPAWVLGLGSVVGPSLGSYAWGLLVPVLEFMLIVSSSCGFDVGYCVSEWLGFLVSGCWFFWLCVGKMCFLSTECFFMIRYLVLLVLGIFLC